jgi:hypothetical protein
MIPKMFAKTKVAWARVITYVKLSKYLAELSLNTLMTLGVLGTPLVEGIG